MVPTEMLVIPWFVMSADFGWVDTYWGLLFPGLIPGFGVFLMRQFFQTLPRDLFDAGRIDGVSEFGLFLRIGLPLVGPGMAALGIFAFIGNWNAFLWPLIVAQSAVDAHRPGRHLAVLRRGGAAVAPDHGDLVARDRARC